MDVRKISKNASLVWCKLNGTNQKFEFKELVKITGLSRRDLNTAIGWLAREGKIEIAEQKESKNDFLSSELNFYIG